MPYRTYERTYANYLYSQEKRKRYYFLLRQRLEQTGAKKIALDALERKFWEQAAHGGREFRNGSPASREELEKILREDIRECARNGHEDERKCFAIPAAELLSAMKKAGLLKRRNPV